MLAEARVNPDGTLDFTRWARPQNDGPALEVLALSRWRNADLELDETLRAAMLELVIGDLDFIRARVSERSFDIWEEEPGYHYYTQLVQAEALVHGAEWLEEAGDAARRSRLPFSGGRTRAESGRLLERERRLLPLKDWRRRRRPGKGSRHFGDSWRASRWTQGGTHSVLDPRAQATLAALEDLFDAEYPINCKRPPEHGPAMGRYANDAYYGGNPWYLATLAAAEFYFRLAIALKSGGRCSQTSENERFRRRLIAADGAPGNLDFAAAALERGDTFMRTVQAYTPASGDLSEQFDRTTGAQISAKHLAWSYAAFITAAASRRRAVQAIRG